MRARLDHMGAGTSYRCICLNDMAERMERAIKLASGEITERDERRCGVVLTLSKLVCWNQPPRQPRSSGR